MSTLIKKSIDLSISQWSDIHSLSHPQAVKRELSCINNIDREKFFDCLTYLLSFSCNTGVIECMNSSVYQYLRSLHFLTKGLSDLIVNNLLSLTSDYSTVLSPQICGQVNGPGYEVIHNALHPDLLHQLHDAFIHSSLTLKHSVSRIQTPYSLLVGQDSIPGRWSNYISLASESCYQHLLLKIIRLLYSVINQRGIYFADNGPFKVTETRFSLSKPQPVSTSFSQDELSQQALLWHSDYHGTFFYKVFIPLTPFNSDFGSHSYLTNSHFQKPCFYADTRYTDKQVNQSNLHISDFNLDIGDILIENTCGLHRGIKASKYLDRKVLILLIQKSLVFQDSISNSPSFFFAG